jgi:hypothetical protein
MPARRGRFLAGAGAAIGPEPEPIGVDRRQQTLTVALTTRQLNGLHALELRGLEALRLLREETVHTCPRRPASCLPGMASWTSENFDSREP